MATLKDVAKLANVDVSTVSRALNNTSYVHPETKKKIMDAVEKLSYHPNVVAKALRQGKRHTIGIVLPKLALSAFADIAQGVEEQARARGYAALISNTGNDPEVEKQILNRLRNGLVDAIIIAGTGHNLRLLRDMKASGITIVQVIRRQEPTISSVVMDYKECGYRATKQLIESGSRHIGIVMYNQLLVPYKLRYEGYHKAMQEAGLDEYIGEYDAVDTSIPYGLYCTQKLLDEPEDLDGVVVPSDAQGIGALRALKLAGKSVPNDVQVISLTGYNLGSMLETTLTSMEMHGREMGAKAVDIAINDMDNNSVGGSVTRDLTMSATLELRESTRQAGAPVVS